MSSSRPLRHFAVVRVVLPAAAEWTELSWFAFDSSSRCVAQGAAELSSVPGHDTLEVVLSAKRVSAHCLSLPVQAGKHLDALIGQALEDRLLGDKADVLRMPGPQSGTERLVWVCSRSWLEAQLERIAGAGLVADRLFPAYELLADGLADGGELTPCAATPDGWLFRTPDGRFGLAATQPEVVLLSGAEARLLPELYRLPTPAACGNRLPGILARFGHKAFDPRRLYRAALLLALCGGLLLLGGVVHWRQLENRESRLQHEIRQTFATTFPGTPIIDPLLQWESKRREQSAPSRGDALDAVLALASKLNLPIHPRRLEARDGVVRLTLTDTELAQFKTQLDSAGSPEASPAESGLTRLQFSPAR